MSEAKPPGRPRLIVLLPLIAFLAVAMLFFYMMEINGRDPNKLPSALIGRTAPQTDLPPVDGLVVDGKQMPGLATADFKGGVTILNVWASWCIPCRDEAPVLLTLAEDKRIRLVGLNYKDQPENARRFIGRYGNPYAANGADVNGRAGIEWGVYGVPETFVIDRTGKIVYKLVGPLTPGNLQGVIKPEIEKALKAAGS